MKYSSLKVSLPLPFIPKFCGVDSENHVQSVPFEIDLLETLSLSDVVQTDVSALFLFGEAVFDPQDIFRELGLAHPRKPNPDPALIERQHSPAPAEQCLTVLAGPVNLMEVDDLVDFKAVTVGNHDFSVHGREVNAVTDDQAIVGLLNLNVDAPSRAGQANRILLRMPGDPYFLAQLKDCIGMRAVGLRAIYFSIVHVAREARPRVFPQHTPFLQHLACRREFHDHVQARVCHQKVAVMRRHDMMEIVKRRQRYVTSALEAGHLKNQYLG